MKTLLAVGLILFLIAPAIQAQLTKDDLREIESIVQRNQQQLREYMDVKFAAQAEKINNLETRMNALSQEFGVLKTQVEVEYDNINKQLQMLMTFIISLIALIAVAIALPPIIMALRERTMAERQKEIDRLREELEAFKKRTIAMS
jgi:hypothetical protein